MRRLWLAATLDEFEQTQTSEAQSGERHFKQQRWPNIGCEDSRRAGGALIFDRKHGEYP